MNFNKLIAELIGTFTLVSAVLGAALVSFSALGGGSGILGVAIAVGLAVMGMAYALGPISGGHFNPAVTLGLWSAGRFETKDIIPYIIAQVIGGLLSALFFYILLSTKADFAAGGFASNGYGEHSPAGFSLFACLIA
jgi:aquaporin Z